MRLHDMIMACAVKKKKPESVSFKTFTKWPFSGDFEVGVMTTF